MKFIESFSAVYHFRPKMDEAKEVHKCLRTAAGIFTLIKVSFLFVCFELKPTSYVCGYNCIQDYVVCNPELMMRKNV
jgi:hypothetical protein